MRWKIWKAAPDNYQAAFSLDGDMWSMITELWADNGGLYSPSVTKEFYTIDAAHNALVELARLYKDVKLVEQGNL